MKEWRRMAERQPFIFGVNFIEDASGLKNLLHQQFCSDEALAKHVRSQGFEVDFTEPKITCDSDTGVIVETVGVNKDGGVGSLDLIDEGDRPKLQQYINSAHTPRISLDNLF